MSPDVFTVGASGAAFGLMGALAVGMRLPGHRHLADRHRLDPGDQPAVHLRGAGHLDRWPSGRPVRRPRAGWVLLQVRRPGLPPPLDRPAGTLVAMIVAAVGLSWSPSGLSRAAPHRSAPTTGAHPLRRVSRPSPPPSRATGGGVMPLPACCRPAPRAPLPRRPPVVAWSDDALGVSSRAPRPDRTTAAYLLLDADPPRLTCLDVAGAGATPSALFDVAEVVLARCRPRAPVAARSCWSRSGPVGATSPNLATRAASASCRSLRRRRHRPARLVPGRRRLTSSPPHRSAPGALIARRAPTLGSGGRRPTIGRAEAQAGGPQPDHQLAAGHLGGADPTASIRSSSWRS